MTECATCPNLSRPCTGACPCLADGRSIVVHFRASYCPLGRFGSTVEPAGWADVPTAEAASSLPPAARTLPIASDAEIEAMFETERKVGGCGCAGGYTDVSRPK